MTFVVGSRANSAAAQFPDSVTSALSHAAAAGQDVTLIRLDGRPEPFLQTKLQSTAQNSVARQDELSSFLGTISKQLATGTKAKIPQADDLSALSVASRSTPPGGTIVFADSGLQTVAPLNFSQNDLLLAQPSDIVDFLKRSRLLPDLSGRNIIFLGLGNTALPQQGLDEMLRSNLSQIWLSIAKAAGACVDNIVSAASQEPISGVPIVTPVNLPPPPAPPRACGDTVLNDQNNVGFLPNTTTFRDDAAARTTIAEIADIARAGNQKIDLIGTSARYGSNQSQIDLSQRRAARVRDVLVELGINSGRISVTGVGSLSAEFYTPDGGPNALEPAAAAQNRRVIARLICH